MLKAFPISLLNFSLSLFAFACLINSASPPALFSSAFGLFLSCVTSANSEITLRIFLRIWCILQLQYISMQEDQHLVHLLTTIPCLV